MRPVAPTPQLVQTMPHQVFHHLCLLLSFAIIWREKKKRDCMSLCIMHIKNTIIMKYYIHEQ